ncbi:MAG: TolC family protein [Cystobacterineae bacterium]|nr:TolC family protein [Cystobacterineae bacterium]
MSALFFVSMLAGHVVLGSVVLGSTFAEENPLELTLEFCQQSAEQNSKVLLQKQSLNEANQAQLASINTRYFPQLEFQAQASWQSEVTSLPSFPGLQVSPLSKDQYRFSIEFQQLIYDGSRLSAQKKLQSATHEMELKQADMALFQLKTQVLQIFLEILFLEEQQNILKTLKADLILQQKTLQAGLASGIALKNHVDMLDAEILKTEQGIFETWANKMAAIKILSEITGKEISPQAVFVIPERKEPSLDTQATLNRPEIQLFQAQLAQGEAQKNQIFSKALPQLSLYASLAYGRPGFDFLKSKFDFFGIVAVRLQVPLTEWWAMSQQKDAISQRQKAIQAQKADFESIQHRELIRLKEAQEKYEALVSTDDAIIQKRKSIAQRTAQALSNGIVTPNDYISDINAEKQAMLDQQRHKLLRLQAILTFEHILGGD